MKRALAAAAGFALVGGLAVAAQVPTATAAPPAPKAPKALAQSAAQSLVANRPAALHASADDQFVQHAALSGPGGLQYVPYDRTYKGLPVYGGDFVVVTNAAGQVQNTTVAQTSAINVSTTAKLTAAQAQSIARAQAGSNTVDSVSAAKQTVLAVGAPRLAWETVVASHHGVQPSKLHVFVDATSGAVAYKYDQVADGNGTGAINGPNPVHLDTSSSGGTFSMTDPNHTTLKCQDAANNTTFTGPDDNWGNGTATNKETGCVDALFSSQTEFKMLSAWLGRNGPDGNGGAWPLRVGLNDQNAYYDGTQVQIGKNTAGEWIGSLDVVAHEQGHGIDDHTPGGISGGGTQEFVADVFGGTTETYAAESAPYDVPDWTVGEEINLVGNGPIRNMYNPSALGDPNCYSSSIPSTEVHAAAGPGNHWYYLLAIGSNATGQPASSTCNGSSGLVGVGVQTAIKIFYNAMLMKTTSSSYLKYRTWTLTAAKNLTPNDCTNFNKVKAAWDAVSVPAQSADPTCTTGGNTVTVTNPGSQTGTVGTAVSLQLSASGGTAPYTWSATGLPAGLSISSSGLISGTPTTATTYTVTATATDSTTATGSAQFSWTINPTGSGGCSGQKLVNPGFESGAASWTASSGVINTDSAHSRTGTGYSWLNGYGQAHTDTLSQVVAIPAGCSASLTYYLYISSSEGTTTAYDKLTLTANGTTVQTFSNVNKGTGYVARTVSLSGYAGQSITLKWTGTEDSSLATSFYIDDTALNLS